MVYQDITFAPSPDPDHPGEQGVLIECPRGYAAIEGVYVTGSGSVFMTGSTPTAGGDWRFTGRNYSHSGQSQKVTVQVRCLQGEDRRHYLPLHFSNIPAGESIQLPPVACRKGQLAVGWGEKHPDAGEPGVSTRIRALDLSGRRFTETIQSSGTADQRIGLQVVCMDRTARLNGDRVRFDDLGIGGGVSARPNQFVELGRICPRTKGGHKILGALVTEVSQQPSSIFYYPVPFSNPHPATRFSAPASIYNSSSSTATVHGTTDCLGYRRL